MTEASSKRRRAVVGGDAGDGNEENDEDESLVFRRASAVFFHTDVTKASVLRLVNLLHAAAVCALRAQASPLNSPCVTLYIHSDSGDVHAGLSAMAHIANCALPVVAIADGLVASAATLLLMGARERYALPHANVLCHQVQADCSGKLQDVRDDVANAELLTETMVAVYRDRTLMGEQLIRRLLRRELCLGTEQCVRWGIASAVLAAPRGWVPTRVAVPRLAPNRGQRGRAAAAAAAAAANASGAPQPQSTSFM